MRPYNVALITLDPDVAPAFIQQNGIEDTSMASLAAEEAWWPRSSAGSTRPTSSWPASSRSRSSQVLPVEWEPGGEELTPTMKLKRKPISAKYAAEIEALYSK